MRDMALMATMPASTVPNTVSSASGLRTTANGSLPQQIAHDPAADRRQRGEDQRSEQRVLASICEHHAGEGERHGADEGENAKPLAIECLVGQHRQRVQRGDAAEFTAAPKLIDPVIEASQHLRRLRRAAQHEMNVGGEAQRMLFDARAFPPAPGGGGGSDPIGEEAVDDAGQEISQVLGIVGNWNDLVPMRRIGDEGVEALVGVDEPGNDPEAKLLLGEGVEHRIDRAERISAAGTSGQDENVRLRSIWLGKIREPAARLVRRRAGCDVRRPGGKRRELVLPSDFRQQNFHAHEARERALDFHVEAGQDRNAPPVIAVLIRVPRIPAAAKLGVVCDQRAEIGLRRDGGLRGRDARQQQPCEGGHCDPPGSSHEARVSSRPPLHHSWASPGD
jgi:hypothetical protein